MPNNNERYSNIWFKQAKYDLKAAGDSISSENYEWAYYQAQQSAEKALKAFLFLNRKRNIFTHSIRKLIEKCRVINSQFLDLKKAKKLDQYYFPTRYPNALPDEIPHEFYSEEEAQKCVNYAQKIVYMVGNILKKD